MESEVGLVLFRLSAFLALLSIAFCFGLFPLLLRQRLRGSAEKQDRLLSLANTFAGGLFLGSGFVSMLGEAIEAFEQLTQHDSALVALALCPLGFAAAFFAEKVFFHHHHHHHDPHEDAREHDARHDHHAHHDAPHQAKGGGGGEERPTRDIHYGSFARGSSAEDAEREPLTGEQQQLPSRSEGPIAETPFAEILVAVLSLHSVITGISLGLQQSLGPAVQIFASLALHKCVEAVALGVNLARAGKVGGAFFKPLVIFSAAEPAGVLLGWALFAALAGQAARTATGALTAMASGTFIYVAIVDILLQEFGPAAGDRYLKALLASLGYGVMILFVLFASH